jgi:hypothetical protein
MKLARIDHYRCAQPAGKWGLHSYVWVSDGMTEEALGVLCEMARTRYLGNERAWKDAAPVSPPGYAPHLDPIKDKGKTVDQVYEEWNAKVQAYNEYGEKQKNARKSFAELLVEASNGAVRSFWKEEPTLKYELDWGHNHGVEIDMSATKVPDFPPEDEDEDYL